MALQDAPSLGLPAPKARAYRPVLPKIESDVNFQEFQEVAGDSDDTAITHAPSEPPMDCKSPPLHQLPGVEIPATPPMPGWSSRMFSVDSVAASVASSGWQFAEPTQTLLFLDWDDTLFPCTELFERWCLPRRPLPRRASDDPFPEELERELASWRTAVQEYLSIACALSDRCVIVTNSSPPWVESCVARFSPNLLPFFDGTAQGTRVVYAGETLRRARARAAASGSRCCCPQWRHALWEALGPLPTDEERRAQLTEAKLSAMRQEATNFYSRYPGQTWKNVISLGDMKYERDAVQELSASRASVPRERLRTKALVLPGAPSLGELTAWLRLFRLLLPALVRVDGDVDVDLYRAADPLRVLAGALNLPTLAGISFPQLRPDSHAVVPDGPGAYRVTYRVSVGSGEAGGEPTGHVIQPGTFVDVLEVRACPEQRCLRGRVANPPGWITLLNQDTGYRWADKEDDHAIEEALDEVAVAVQDAMAEPSQGGAHALQGGVRSPLLGPAADGGSLRSPLPGSADGGFRPVTPVALTPLP